MVNQQELVLKNSQTNQKPTLEEFADGVRLTEQAEAIQNKKIEFGAPQQVAKVDNYWEGVENGLLKVMNYYKDSNRGLAYYFTENYWEGKYSPESFAHTVGVMWINTESLCTIIKDINWQLIEEQKEKLRLIRENEAVTGNLAELMASLIPNPEQYKDTDPASKLPWALSFIRNEREVNKKRIAELEIELDQKEKIITEIKAALAREGEEAEKLEKLLFKTEENLVKSLQENKKLSEELSEKKGKVSQLDSLFSRGLEKIRKIGRIIALNTKNKNELNIWEKVENLDYLDNLEKMVADLVKEKNSLEETLNVGIEKFHHLDEENKLLREENNISKEKWGVAEEKLVNSEKEKFELVSQLSEENRKLNVQLTNSQRKNNNLTTENNELKAELDQALKNLPMMKGMIEDEIHRITGIRCNITVNEVISKEREREREREIRLSELEKKFGGALLSEIPSDKTLADVYKWNENLRQDLEETTDEFNNTLNDKDKVINDLNSTKKQLETDQWELTAAKRQVDLLLWQLETKEKELSESLTENQRLESGKFNLKRELKNQKREQETINKKLREDLQNNLNILANKEKVIEVFKVNFEKTKEHFQGIIDRNSKDFNVISTKNNRAKEGLKSTLKKKTEAYKKIISERDRQINHLHNTIFERVTERDARPNITHTYYNNLVNERNNLATERNDWQKKWNEESTNHQETQQKLTESAVANSQLKTDLAQVQSDFQQEQNDHQQTQGKLTILVEQHNNCPRKHRKEITEEINQELELNFAENELTFEQVIRRIKELIRNPINDKETLQTQLAEAQAMVTQLQVQLAEKKPDDASVPLELINSIKEDAFQLCQALKISLSPETREKMEKETQHEKLISLRDELIKNHLAQQSNLTAIGTEKSPQRQDEWLIPLILISNLIITWLTIFYLVRRQRLRNK